MTGTVDWVVLEWVVSLIVAVVAVACAAMGVLWGCRRWIDAQFEKRDEAHAEELKQRDMAIQAVDSRARLAEDIISKSLADHKLYAAEHYATEESVGKAIEPILRAIERLGDRLDRVLSDGTHARPRG